MGIHESPSNFAPNKVNRLTRITNPKLSRNIAIYNPSVGDIELLIDIASQQIDGMADPNVVTAMFRHNPECFWALSETGSGNDAVDWPEGFFALLPLNEDGARALARGVLNTGKPDVKYVCRQWERPAAVYFWCIYAPGALSAGVSWWANFYYSPKFQGLPIFAKAGTASGANFFERLGFQEGATWEGVRNDNYISLLPPPHNTKDETPSITRSMPVYDNYARSFGEAPGAKELSCSVASSLDDLLKVMSIRSVVYVGDQECPFDEEWDGNDLSATHIIARLGDEPIGTIRLRTFSDFAKVERLAVLPKYRKSPAAFKLERACSELARALGYRKLIGHAHKNVLKFWISRKWQVLEERSNFSFSDHECVQIEKNIEPHADAISFDSDPLKLIRPSGKWHRLGPLDHSSARPAVNA